MKELFSLGELYISDFLKPDESPRHPPVELKLMFNEKTGEAKLNETAPSDYMYGRYWYRSGINSTMNKELKDIVDSINSVIKVQKDDVWIDIACNDGTLLSHVSKDVFRVGVDPADDTFKQQSQNHANVIVQDYFGPEAIKKANLNKRAKVITCIAMFYDLEDRETFLSTVYNNLEDDGLFVIQLSYTPLMLEQMAFDNICHEHLYYYSLTNIVNLFNDNGFNVVDCQINDVNGGSFRVYAMKDVGDIRKFGTQPYRDVCNFRVQSLLVNEFDKGYNQEYVWRDFYDNLQELKNQTYDFIVQEKKKGKKIWGYGASTKGNTLLQYFGLDNTLIDGIAERSPYKFGLKTVGTNIPIYSEEEMRKANPDYLLLLPWHFISEFKEREKDYLNSGGKFIVPCPVFEIIGGE